MSIELLGVTKRYGEHRAVDGVSLAIPAGKLTALLGPSGCGKTTLLRMIAGLEAPDAGRVRMSGGDVTSHAARDRQVGFVFQHYALFKHMTVEENVGFALRVRGASREDRRAAAQELLKLVRLEGFGGRFPSQLSGGQRQRVALARALAAKPRILLLDEPFGALDARVRQELRQWLRRLHDEIQVTSVFVTHDQEEALELADRVVVMNRGRIEQEGTAEEVFERPSTPFVMSFLGEVNLFHGRGYARPHEIDLDRSPRTELSLAASVRHVNSAGPTVKIELVLRDEQTRVQADLSRDRHRELGLRPGESVYVVPRRLRVFGEDGGPPNPLVPETGEAR